LTQKRLLAANAYLALKNWQLVAKLYISASVATLPSITLFS